MKHRKLRIAWSVGGGIVCLLLILLWVRSYWWADLLAYTRGQTYLAVGSGRVEIAAMMWEVWDYSGDVYSHNHSMFGTVGAWFFTALGGIQPAEDAVGFDKILLRPQVVGAVTWVKCRYASTRGEVISNRRIEGDEFYWDAIVPPIATAEVRLPSQYASDVRERGQPAAESKGGERAGDSNSDAFRVKSGTHSFSSRSTEERKASPQ